MQISGPKNSIVWGPSVYKELKQELLEYKYIDSLIEKKIQFKSWKSNCLFY